MPVPAAEAARMLDITRGQLAKLIAGGIVASDPRGRPLRTSVEHLAAKAAQPIPTSVGPVLLCPLNPLGDASGTLWLDPATEPALVADANTALARDGLTSTYGGPLPNARYGLSGAWEVLDSKASALAADGGLILGVTAGYVTEAARVVHVAATIPYRNRKLLVIRPSGADQAAWQGIRVGRMNQRPRFL